MYVVHPDAPGGDTPQLPGSTPSLHSQGDTKSTTCSRRVCVGGDTFVNGLDLEAYWDHYHHFTPKFSDHLREICIAKWGTSQFAKSACHAGVIRCLLDLNLRYLQMTDDDNNWFMFPVSEELTTLMFTIRSFSPSAEDFPYPTIDCRYQFPSRYNQYQDWSYIFTYDAQISAAVDGFGGQLPHMLNLRLDSRSI